MTSAYGGTPGDGLKDVAEKLPYLPVLGGKVGGRPVEVGPFRESEWPEGMALLDREIEDGRSWPFEAETWGGYRDMEGFRAYFLSHSAFVVRGVDSGEVMGAFYVKPNFPGRCQHICNGGFIVKGEHRGKGMGRLMAACFLKFARDLGYKASYFNLVFANNDASVRLWESMGFKRVAHVPKCARLKGCEELIDAYGYHYDLESLSQDFDPIAASHR
mmetsp:Transcript_46965/g.117681  ORF Transcript_46965/g.117681 Transcript_46965/m.117681 type:complete len:216 (-) Transcript_46965:63-710(-)|eukprot:CAMPEP_0173453332 /NCGR_PEP_ID=MMETSP1357-20121228/50407_1 /TAXON_ID=77926 /ORGANISM="Hemiselmis rufescens, Strain PCC563" /LENGTH=215 /DNA_ID=CAMNT_0014420289 /DNA_START=256 /DNA_END=903 /DNA_ORIENTATION=+